MSQTFYYICEGVCEKRLIDTLKSSKRIHHGKCKRLNLWDSNISKVIRKISRSDVIVVVFDTDVLTRKTNFLGNISALCTHTKSVILLAQWNNFEEELAYACRLNHSDLPQVLYRITHSDDFKHKICKDNNLLNTLDRNGFDLDRMWCRPDQENKLNIPQKSNLYWGKNKM